MNKTPLQMFEERQEKKCCRNCGNLIAKQGRNGVIYFCDHCGKILLEQFLNCENMMDCEWKRRLNKDDTGTEQRRITKVLL